MERWQKTGDVSGVQRFAVNDPGYATARNESDIRISDASFIRLKNVSLTYQVRRAWVERIGLQQVKLFAQGQNLLTITRYLGSDPETQNTRTLPPLRVMTVGIQFTL